jgi:hypothetical protein
MLTLLSFLHRCCCCCRAQRPTDGKVVVVKEMVLAEAALS